MIPDPKPQMIPQDTRGPSSAWIRAILMGCLILGGFLIGNYRNNWEIENKCNKFIVDNYVANPDINYCMRSLGYVVKLPFNGSQKILPEQVKLNYSLLPIQRQIEVIK